MGDSTDLFEDLRERGYEEKVGKGRGSSVEPVEAPEASAPSAPPAHDQVDLEAPLLEEQSQQGIQEQEQEQAPPVLEPAPTPSENDPLLYVFRVLSIVTAVAALLCLVVNAISLFRSFDYRGFDYRVSVFVGILRCYTAIFAVLVILAETEWERLFRFWRLLEYWVGRGLLQILVAVLTRVLKRASGETSAEGLLHEIASWLLFGCGCVYVVAGLLCLGRIKRNRLKKQNWRVQAQKDLEELHRRRADLEGQLAKH
ncbi:hypothetical protein KC19_7G073700 [Ceratodon purpureus]|uniref:Golgi apparatus membrane protein TVP15 n=1 Tax=Ceratodon purpureus TaxID=3225 RepID=A0A8T0H5J4_CERPU|nr:hypothetical protein KC19_7G073700 [Ceratodon purpureus]